MRRPQTLIRLALPLAAAGLLLCGVPAQACSSKTVDTIVYQAARNGSVSDGYSVECLRAARAAEGPDLSAYSDVDQILQAAIARSPITSQLDENQSPSSTTPQIADPAAGRQKGHGAKRVQEGLTSAPPVVRPPSTSEGATQAPRRGPVVRLLNAGSQGPDSVPLPVIVLAALAALLTLAGGVSVIVRRRL